MNAPAKPRSAAPTPFASSPLALAALWIGLLLPASILAQDYEPPRTQSGKPDLQGYWSNASLTQLQRNANYENLVIPASEIEDFTRNNHQNVRQATDDGLVQGELLDGSDLGKGRGYNAFWVDPGTRYGIVKGEARTSWIVEPEDGRIPFSDAGNDLRRVNRAKFSGNDGPEGRALGERCIIGFGSTGGCRDDRHRCGATAIRVFVPAIQCWLIAGIGMDRRHKPFVDANGVVQNHRNRSQTIRRTGGR